MLLVSSLGAALRPGSGWAQLNLVDPDVKAKRAPGAERAADADGAKASPTSPTSPRGSDADAKAKAAAKAGAKPVDAAPAGPAAPSLLVDPVSDADLAVAWRTWTDAVKKNDIKAEQAARAALVKLKKSVAAKSMELWSVGLTRVAAKASERGDHGAAVEMARSATELAPALPAAWTALAWTYVRADPTDLGRVVTTLKTALSLSLADLRYQRATLADFGAIVIFSWIALACVVLFVFLLRRGYYALFDFHFFFPRAAARWQTGALFVLVLLMPIVFRLGLVAVLLTAFLAVTLYLTSAERAVAVVLIGVIGVLPVVGGVIAERAVFSETPARAVFEVDNGGVGSERTVAELDAKAQGRTASFAELFTLGTWRLRRGDAERAAQQLKDALALSPKEARALNNLGVAQAALGDWDNARVMFEDASKADPSLAAAHFNMGRIFQRRYQLLGDAAAGDIGRASTAFNTAQTLDPSLTKPEPLSTKEPTPLSSAFALTALPEDVVRSMAQANGAGDRVRSQLVSVFVGRAPEPVAYALPLLLAVLVALAGRLGPKLRASKVCTKCGRPCSTREDPELSLGSLMCTQCVNVFVNKNAAAPSLKVRKQAEVERYHQRTDRIAYGLGVLCAGMGHVFSGLPVRGLVYAFFFLFAVVGFVWRDGAVRAPFDAVPVWLKLVPLGLLFGSVYVVALRGLRKRQQQG